jgi:mycothiol synthase
MKLHMRSFQSEEDYWRIRNFLRQVFLLNGRREHSWHVARLDYWRWHLILNCQVCDPVEKVTALWETADAQIAAVLHRVGWGEVRLHVHPQYCTTALEHEILAYAEEYLAERGQDGRRTLHVPVFANDLRRQVVLTERGYTRLNAGVNHWQRDLDEPIPEALPVPGYTVRSMGDLSEHPSRSWASWRAFHSDEPEANYDGDWSWYQNIQSAPLYRRDLDIVAAAADGGIAAFCTIFYDDFTRSAVSVLVGVAAEHWRRGLGKAVMTEGIRCLQKLGGTRLFANGFDPPADALYRSVLGRSERSETWWKEF